MTTDPSATAPNGDQDRSTSQQIAHYLGLTEWQAKFLDEVMERASRGERPVYRFLGRKVGYGWAWEKADDGT